MDALLVLRFAIKYPNLNYKKIENIKIVIKPKLINQKIHVVPVSYFLTLLFIDTHIDQSHGLFTIWHPKYVKYAKYAIFGIYAT